jgi:hypothetical protein
MGGAQYFAEGRLATGVKGADAIAKAIVGRARAARPAYIGEEPAAAWVHEGRMLVVFRFKIAADRITEIELVGDPETLKQVALE